MILDSYYIKPTARSPVEEGLELGPSPQTSRIERAKRKVRGSGGRFGHHWLPWPPLINEERAGGRVERGWGSRVDVEGGGGRKGSSLSSS